MKYRMNSRLKHPERVEEDKLDTEEGKIQKGWKKCNTMKKKNRGHKEKSMMNSYDH